MSTKKHTWVTQLDGKSICSRCGLIKILNRLRGYKGYYTSTSYLRGNVPQMHAESCIPKEHDLPNGKDTQVKSKEVD